ILVLQNRNAVAAAIAGESPTKRDQLSGARRFLADHWHFAALLYIGMVLTVWMVRPDEGFLFVVRATVFTVVAIVLASIAARLLLRGIERIFRVTDDIRQRSPALEARANRYLQIVNSVVVVAIYGFAAISIMQAWGMRSFAWFETPLGQRVSTSVV